MNCNPHEVLKSNKSLRSFIALHDLAVCDNKLRSDKAFTYMYIHSLGNSSYIDFIYYSNALKGSVCECSIIEYGLNLSSTRSFQFKF